MLSLLKLFLPCAHPQRMRFISGLLMCLCYHAVLSQDQLSPDYTEIKGVLIDSLTSRPIPSAYIWSNHFKTVSNPDGSFSIFVFPTDSVHFWHVSYQDMVVQFHPLKHAALITIAMIEKVTPLEAVTVYTLSE